MKKEKLSPFYITKLSTLFNGDCIDVMNQLINENVVYITKNKKSQLQSQNIRTIERKIVCADFFMGVP